MKKRKKSSDDAVFGYMESQRKHHEQVKSLGDTYARSHYFKMLDRTQRWLDGLEVEINAVYRLNQYPSRWMLMKLDLLRWMHRKYSDAAMDYDHVGLMSVVFTLIVGVIYIVILMALYVLLAIALIWATPYAFDWLFSIE